MPDRLDISLREAFNDRALIHRLVRCIQLDKGVEYIEALEHLHQAAEGAESTGDPTVRGALEWAGDPKYLEQSLKLLERRDAAVEAKYSSAAADLLLEQTDPSGRVLLDQSGMQQAFAERGASEHTASSPAPRIPTGRLGEPLTSDVGKVLGDPQEFERRYHRIHRTPMGPRYDGPDGRESFRNDDRVNADAGLDLVRTAERPAEVAAARAKADQLGQRLDTIIDAAAGKRKKLKLLEQEMAKLDAPDAVREATRAKLQTETETVHDAALTLLDRLGAPETTEPASGGSSDELAEVQTRIGRLTRDLRILERSADSDTYYLDAFRDEIAQLETRRQELQVDQTLRTLTSPAPADVPPKPDVPAGIYGGSHDLHERVKKRMRLLDRHDREYARTLEEIVQEERADR